MSRKRYTPEQIIGKLREAEMALSQGMPASTKPPSQLFSANAIPNYQGFPPSISESSLIDSSSNPAIV